MSYEILRSVKFDKKEKTIMVTSASNNVSPRTYCTWEYKSKGMSFEQNIEYFFVDMLNGNIQGGRGHIKDILHQLENLKDQCAPDVSFDRDLKLKTGFSNGLDHLVARIWAVPTILKQEISIASVWKTIQGYNEEAVKGYTAKEQEYADAGWTITGSCSSSSVFPGYIVWAKADGSGFILGEHSCYEKAQLGFCNTKAGKTIEINNEFGDVFHLLSNGYNRDLTEETFGKIAYAQAVNPKLWEMLAAAGLKMACLPYKGFPYKKYGFELDYKLTGLWKTFLEQIKDVSTGIGMYDVLIEDRRNYPYTEYSTQGNIPDEEYTWDEFFEWLVQDIREMGIDPARTVITGIDYAGNLLEV